MARKRGKLKGKAKAAFLRRMAAGRRKAAGKSNPAPKRRRRKARKNPVAARSNPIRRRRKSRKDRRNPIRVRRNKSRKARKNAAHKVSRVVRRRRRKARKNPLVVTKRRSLRGLHRRGRKHSIGVSGPARKWMKLHGVGIRTNPSGGAAMASLKALPGLLPEALAGAGAFGLILLGSQKVSNMIVEKYGATSPSLGQVAAPAVSALWTVAAFIGLRMHPKTAKFSGPVLVGGTIATAAAVLSSVVVKGKPGEGNNPATFDMSLGRHLGLPIGDFLTPGVDTGMHLAAYVPRADLAAYVPASELAAYVPRADLASYVPRADLAGYLPVGNSESSADAEMAQAISELMDIEEEGGLAGF